MTELRLPVRVLRGPRAAAYWATYEALTKIKADRDSFPVTMSDIPVDRNDIFGQRAHEMRTQMPDRYLNEESGVIKSIKKGKDGVRVEFAKDKQERWHESCTNTNRIVTWDHDARPIYDRNCKGKVVKVDVSPYAILVPEAHAEGLAPNRLVKFGVQTMSGDKRLAMPFEVYKDKKGKGLVAWMTLGL
jgi:hypothetical protein